MVWMDEYRVMPKTILSAFNHVRLYEQHSLASNAPFINKNNIRESNILSNFSQQERDGILRVRKKREDEYLGDHTYVEKLTDRYPINQDWKPICEYFLGIKARKVIYGL